MACAQAQRTDRAIDAHDDRINSMLAAHYYRRNDPAGMPDRHHTPLAALTESDELDTPAETAIRTETLARFFAFCAQDDPHPANVMRNFFAVVHAIAPDAFGASFTDLSCSEYALLFAESKVAHSNRCRLLFTKFLAARGAKTAIAGFQRCQAAGWKFGRAQLQRRKRRK